MRPHDMLREFAGLNQKRKTDGVTPLEYQRWLDLGRRLAKAFPDLPKPARSGRVCIVVEFKSREELREVIMMNVRPIGLFIQTPFPPDEGTTFDLRVRVQETEELLSSRVVVVSNNVGPDYSTQCLGMGVRFCQAACELRAVLDELSGVGEDPGATRRAG